MAEDKETMNPEEALAQINYLKEVIAQTRLRVADGYPHFLWWGLIWIFGDLCGLWLKHQQYGLLWVGLSILGGAGSTIFGIQLHSKQKDKPVPLLLKQLGLLSLTLLLTAGLLFPLTFQGASGKFNSAYWPLWIGIIYVANGIFMGRQLVWIGLWVLIEAAIALYIPGPYFYIWLALAGGGALVATGLVFRKQVIRHG